MPGNTLIETQHTRDYRHLVEKNEFFKRMLEDDSFFDVKDADVKRLLYKMKAAHVPKEEVIRIRVKYWAFIHDCEKQLMESLGLNYDDHEITHRNSLFLINGYGVTCWRMLTDDDYFPTRRQIQHAVAEMKKRNDEEALKTLYYKYGMVFAERDEQILVSHGLPPDTRYTTLETNKIDGITFIMWHLLYDDDYKPSKQALVSCLYHLRKSQRDNDVKMIENKYRDILYPNWQEEITEEEIRAAEKYFKHFLD